MATAQLFSTLAAFLSGIFYVELPSYRLGVILLILAGLILGPRVRVLLLLALVGGILDATYHAKNLLFSPGIFSQSSALVIALHEGQDGCNETIALDDGTLLETWFPTAQAPEIAHKILISGTLVAFDDARNPGAPSPKAFAAARGVQARLIHPRLIADLGIPTQDPRTWLPLARHWTHLTLQRELDPLSAQLLGGVLWGERSALATPLHDAFVTTGTVHVLVTAGLHVGILLGLIMSILQGSRLGRGTAALGAIPLILLYAAFAGGRLPVMRAAMTASFFLLARVVGAQITGWRSFGIALILNAAIEPSAPTQLAFWLSACCVGSILAFYQPLTTSLRALPKLVREGLALTIAAQLGTWPLIAYALHQLSLCAPLANLLVVPAISLLLTGGFALLSVNAVTALFPLQLPWLNALPHHCGAWLGEALALSCALIAHAIIGIVVWLAKMPNASNTLPDPPLLALFLYYGSLSAAAHLITHPANGNVRYAQWHLRLNARQSALTLVALAQAIPLAGIFLTAYPRSLEITMLDVGQGDGIVLETPLHHTILIDTGGQLERNANTQAESPAERAGGSVLLPFLAHEGIHRIDLLVLTHPHGDHVGGAAPILRTMPVGLILDSGQAYPGRAYRDAIATAHLLHVPIHIARRGEQFRTDDGLRLDVLAPFAQPLAPSKNAINEGSIILRVGFAHWHMLFTGDAGMPTEARLLAAGDVLSSDVLKVGHHGSAGATSQGFVQAIHPQFALISVGRHNLFHHPAEQTLNTLQAQGIVILRTDQCGAISVSTSEVHSMLPCEQNSPLLHPLK